MDWARGRTAQKNARLQAGGLTWKAARAFAGLDQGAGRKPLPALEAERIDQKAGVCVLPLTVYDGVLSAVNPKS
jgi:hypothetical protein